MEIYTEVPSAATRDALKKLGPWLGSQARCTLLYVVRPATGMAPTVIFREVGIGP